MLSFYPDLFYFRGHRDWSGIVFLSQGECFKFLKYIKEEILIVLGTSSSESALPGIMQKMEDAGCAKPVVGLVIPTGYSFNWMGQVSIDHGCGLYFAGAQYASQPGAGNHLITGIAIDVQRCRGRHRKWFCYPRCDLACCWPCTRWESVALIFGVDRFMSEARAITNLIGNSAATLVISKYENSLDEDLLHEKLGSKRV